MLRKYPRLFSLFFVLIGLALVTGLGVGTAVAATRLVSAIFLFGNDLETFDISFVDPDTRLYFLGDRSNAGVDVFSIDTDEFLFRVPGFRGFTGNNDTSGPDGVVANGDLVFAGDGDSTLKVISLSQRQIIQTIPTGGVKRVDEMAADFAGSQTLLAANNAEDTPFATLFDISSAAAGAVTILAGPIFIQDIPCNNNALCTATNGIEQPAFDPNLGLYFVSIPQVNNSDTDGGVAVIDTTGTVLQVFIAPGCHPNGLVVGPRDELLLGCNNRDQTVIMSAVDGTIVATIPQVAGSDEVAFNPANGLYYTASSNFTAVDQVLGVIDSATNTWVENVATVETIGGVTPARNAHSVAVDPVTNHVFVPLPAGPGNGLCPGCIGVFEPLD